MTPSATADAPAPLRAQNRAQAIRRFKRAILTPLIAVFALGLLPVLLLQL